MTAENGSRDPSNDFADESADGPSTGAASLGVVDVAAVRTEIERIGYTVVPDIVDATTLRNLREFWLAEYARPCPVAPMVWGPYLGEPNGAVFDDRSTHCFYRAFDYLWNTPYDPSTRRIALALNRVRNRIVGADERDGELMAPDRYGVYVTTSYYPCGSGWMHMHPDTAQGRRHWHFILPLTFRGTDYAAGGLALIDRAGARVDIEAKISPGSVVFYDGALTHGVDRIEGGDGRQTGRLQMFAIPTFFDLPAANRRHAAGLPTGLFLRAKLSRLKARLLKGRAR